MGNLEGKIEDLEYRLLIKNYSQSLELKNLNFHNEKDL